MANMRAKNDGIGIDGANTICTIGAMIDIPVKSAKFYKILINFIKNVGCKLHHATLCLYSIYGKICQNLIWPVYNCD